MEPKLKHGVIKARFPSNSSHIYNPTCFLDGKGNRDEVKIEIAISLEIFEREDGARWIWKLKYHIIRVSK